MSEELENEKESNDSSLTDPPKTGYVYLMSAPDLNRCKIGFTKNYLRRYQEIKNQAPCKTHILDCVESNNYKQDERKLHQMFQHRRKYGEWFEFDSEDQALGLFREYFRVRKIYEEELNVLKDEINILKMKITKQKDQNKTLQYKIIALIKLVKKINERKNKIQENVLMNYERRDKINYKLFHAIKILLSKRENFVTKSLIYNVFFALNLVKYIDDESSCIKTSEVNIESKLDTIKLLLCDRSKLWKKVLRISSNYSLLVKNNEHILLNKCKIICVTPEVVVIATFSEESKKVFRENIEKDLETSFFISLGLCVNIMVIAQGEIENFIKSNNLYFNTIKDLDIWYEFSDFSPIQIKQINEINIDTIDDINFDSVDDDVPF